MYFFICVRLCVFFFKQKTAYEMRISDWSSDVCSSDLYRRIEPAADQLWWWSRRDPRMVAARRPDRPHPHGRGRIPPRRDDPVGRPCTDADQQRAGRSADLVAARPRQPVFPTATRTGRQIAPDRPEKAGGGKEWV